MSEKRVKAGIALTPKHLKLCDENLTRAGVRSRNSFVERAIEFYVNYLLTQELPQLHRDGFDTNRFETLCKSLDRPVQDGGGAGHGGPSAVHNSEHQQ